MTFDTEFQHIDCNRSINAVPRAVDRPAVPSPPRIFVRWYNLGQFGTPLAALGADTFVRECQTGSFWVTLFGPEVTGARIFFRMRHFATKCDTWWRDSPRTFPPVVSANGAATGMSVDR